MNDPQQFFALEDLERRAHLLASSLFMWRMSLMPGGTEAPAEAIHRERACRELREFLDVADMALLCEVSR